jgi:hypothetical protein
MASAPGLGQNVTETQQPAAPLGELVVVEDGDRVVCHVCGRAFAFLPGYLGRHRLTAGEYRERFGLGRSTPLCAPAVLVRRRELGLDRYAGNSRLRAGLATGQKMARSGQLLELSHAGQPAGSARLQSRRRAGQRTEPTRDRTKEQAQQRLAARLVELGFPGDLSGYLRRRYLEQGWPVLRVARELGIGNPAIKLALDQAGVVRRRPGGAETARARWRRTT